MGGHWITYFYALKLSNVAIGMLSLFAYPIFTALLEPFFIKVKFDSHNRVGQAHKTIAVTSNANPPFTDLVLTGEVVAANKK